LRKKTAIDEHDMGSPDENTPMVSPRSASKGTCHKILVGCIAVVALVALLCLGARALFFGGTGEKESVLIPSSSAATRGESRLRARYANSSAPASIAMSILTDAGGSGHNGYLAVIDNASPHFHIEGLCNGLRKTSATARDARCRYAVNGGPYQSHISGGCIGPMISHGSIINEDWQTSFASFGLTSSGSWVVGHISEQMVSKLKIIEALTGFMWLVREGHLLPLDDTVKAQRTAIGIDKVGRLLLFQVDGCEHCPFTGGPSGLTLARLAQLLVTNGAWHAIALDGGGSSTTVVNGKVENQPDCLDMGLTCERPVTSAVCIA